MHFHSKSNRFAMPGIPTFNAGQLAAPGLPKAAPRDWFPCAHNNIDIDPQDIIDDDSQVFFPGYTLEQLQCLYRNEEAYPKWFYGARKRF
jgi:hypothetical protein